MTLSAGDEVPPVADSPAGAACDASGAQALIGQAASQELGSRALQLSSARALRWIRPGDAVTMDYRPDRLNIELDGSGRVAAVRCG